MENSNFENEEVKEFFRLEVANLAENTQEAKMRTISKFLDIIGNPKAKDIEKKHILKYIESDHFTNLANSTKNLRITQINTFLKFFERDDLLDLFPDYKTKDKELNKNELINRDDLNKILKSAGSIRYKTLIMLLFESGIRKGELLGIKKKDLQFYEEYCNLYIDTSKTTKRNIPLVESIPYLREYLNKNNLKEGEKLFDYTGRYINTLLSRIEKATKEKFPSFNKHLNPHLFRHSRLTELASNRKLNEPQLRKFAGWSKSSNMPAIYFHLDDSSIRNEIISQTKKEKPKKPKNLGFETLRCTNCNELNNKFNEFCWKCGKVINKDLVAKKLEEQQELERLKKENQKVKEKVKSLTKTMEKQQKLIKRIMDKMK